MGLGVFLICTEKKQIFIPRPYNITIVKGKQKQQSVGSQANCLVEKIEPT